MRRTDRKVIDKSAFVESAVKQNTCASSFTSASTKIKHDGGGNYLPRRCQLRQVTDAVGKGIFVIPAGINAFDTEGKEISVQIIFINFNSHLSRSNNVPKSKYPYLH